MTWWFIYKGLTTDIYFKISYLKIFLKIHRLNSELPFLSYHPVDMAILSGSRKTTKQNTSLVWMLNKENKSLLSLITTKMSLDCVILHTLFTRKGRVVLKTLPFNRLYITMAHNLLRFPIWVSYLIKMIEAVQRSVSNAR